MVTKENNGIDCYCPHSYVDRESPAGVIPGDWRQDARNLNGITHIESLRSSNNYGVDARLVREELKTIVTTKVLLVGNGTSSEKQYDQLNVALIFIFTL